MPVYSLNGFLALRFRHNRIWFDLPRECYEAYVIYSFYMYLIQFLEDEYTDVPKLLEGKPPMRHLFPCNFLFRRWKMGEEFLRHCKSGILNYVILRPLMTAIHHRPGGVLQRGGHPRRQLVHLRCRRQQLLAVLVSVLPAPRVPGTA